MYNQNWPHQDDPQDFSTASNYKKTQGFNCDWKSVIIFNNPDTPHKGIVSNQEIDANISKYLHKGYMSSVGSLLYLVNLSQPKLSNAVREL